jgi:hypothetical protein
MQPTALETEDRQRDPRGHTEDSACASSLLQQCTEWVTRLGRRVVIIASALGLGLVAACEQVMSPPVVVAYRNSLLGHGVVLIITNASPDKHLIHVSIRATMADGRTREALLDPSLAPGESVEAGWLELRDESDTSADQSALVPGATVEITAHGYGRPERLTVPSTAAVVRKQSTSQRSGAPEFSGPTVLYAVSRYGVNDPLIAVPILVYRNGRYEEPPYCEQGAGVSNTSNATRCREGETSLRPFVERGRTLYALTDGMYDRSLTVRQYADYGLSDWTRPSGELEGGPAGPLLTNDPRLGRSPLTVLDSLDRPVVQQVIPGEGEREDSIRTCSMLAPVDIDRDGSPELVYRCTLWEGVDYEIHARAGPGRWRLVYRGAYDGV